MPGGTQKYEREIAEILERLEKEEPRGERVRRHARFTLRQRWHDWRQRLRRLRGFDRQRAHGGAWAWIGLTLAAGIAGILLHAVLPILGIVCGILMVVIFFSPLLREFISPTADSASSMWRGKVVDLPPRGGILATLRYRWRRLRRRF
ncbi:MAG TPA: hypothetical protein VFW96_11255 [Thermomicrobiales bacterium]|nr:hypothetical protein [Thermomicrobiales bacterium]